MQLRGRSFYLLPWFWVWVLCSNAGRLAAPVNVTLLQALVSSKQQSVRRYINTWRRCEGPAGSYLRRRAGRWWLPPLVFLMSAFDCKRSRTRAQDRRRMLIFLFWAVYWFHQTVLQPPLTFLVAFLKWHQWNKKIYISAGAIRSTWERHPIGTRCNASCRVYIVDVDTAGQRSSLSDS